MATFHIIRMLFLVVVVASTALKAQNPTEIIRQADERARGESSITEVTIQVVRPTWTREMAVKSWSKGQDKSLALVTAPARERGTAFLKVGREMWNWIPSVERTVKLPPSMMSQSWMGTDLTNEDFVREASFVVDYTHTLIGEDTLLNRPAWIIELTPKPEAPVVWGRVVVWIDKADYLQLRAVFYDEVGEPVYTMDAKEVGELGGRTLVTRLEVIPADEPGHSTVMKINSAKFNVPIPDATFTVRHMMGLR